MNFLTQLMNGLELGSIYVLVALGYTMVYGIVKLINFAHGDIIMVGGYMLITAATFWGLPIWLSVIFTVLFCAILGFVIEKVAYKPLRSSPRISSLITAIGVSLFLQNLFMLIFKPDPRTPPKVFSNILNNVFGKESLRIFVNNANNEKIPFDISYSTLLTIVVSVVIMLGLHFFIKKTKIGKAMLAVSEDSGAAQLMGINVNNTISITFAIGSALAAVGSVFYSSIVPQVRPEMGSMLGLKAFVAAVLGGIGIIPGAMIGGLIMGVAESLTKAYINSRLSDAIVFAILIIVLLVKPSGILGKNVKEKV